MFLPALLPHQQPLTEHSPSAVRASLKWDIDCEAVAREFPWVPLSFRHPLSVPCLCASALGSCSSCRHQQMHTLLERALPLYSHPSCAVCRRYLGCLPPPQSAATHQPPASDSSLCLRASSSSLSICAHYSSAIHIPDLHGWSGKLP